MKLKTTLFLAIVLTTAASAYATDVGVSVSISQPGVYGRIDIGHAPPPAVIYPQPIIVTRPVHVVPQPIYMHVPPGHAKNWRKHCHKYDACGTPVYFVKADDDGHRRGEGHKGRGKGRGRDD